jgi:prophage regulatory protein
MAVRVERLSDNTDKLPDPKNRHDRRYQAAFVRPGLDPLGALVRFSEFKQRFGIPYDRSTIHRKRLDGSFPAPLRLSAGTVAWRVSDIEEWLASRPRTSEEPPPSKTKKTKKRAFPKGREARP